MCPPVIKDRKNLRQEFVALASYCDTKIERLTAHLPQQVSFLKTEKSTMFRGVIWLATFTSR